MSTPDRDEEFEAFLARRSLLPRALAERENAEPPLDVDRRVLEEARSAVNAAPARKSSWSNRWPVPVALAATVLLSLAIVVQVQRPSSETAIVARTEQRATTQNQTFEPVTPPMQPDFAPERDAAALRDSPERFAKASAPAETRRMLASANEARRAAQERAEESAAEANAYTAQSRRETMAAAPPPSPSAADEGAAPAPVPADAARARDDAAAEADRSATDSVADSVAAVEAGNGNAAAPAAAAASAERDPKAWLERIAKLRAEGKHAQADREFKAFVKRYPDYVTDEPAR
jgi:hypothetical protein